MGYKYQKKSQKKYTSDKASSCSPLGITALLLLLLSSLILTCFVSHAPNTKPFVEKTANG